MRKTIGKAIHVVFALLCSLLMCVQTVGAESLAKFTSYCHVNAAIYGTGTLTAIYDGREQQTATGFFGSGNNEEQASSVKVPTENLIDFYVPEGTKVTLQVTEDENSSLYDVEVDNEILPEKTYSLDVDTWKTSTQIQFNMVQKDHADSIAEKAKNIQDEWDITIHPVRMGQFTQKETDILFQYNLGNLDYGLEERKAKAAEWNIPDYFLDEDYFVNEDFLNHLDPMFLIYDGLGILSRPGLKTANPSEIAPMEFIPGVKKVGEKDGYWYQNGKSLGHSVYQLSNGQWGWCCQGIGAGPPVGFTWTERTLEQGNEALRKVLYYGCWGPQDILTPSCFGVEPMSICIQAEMCALAVGGPSNCALVAAGFMDMFAIVQDKYNAIQAQPTPPGNFRVYKLITHSTTWQGWYPGLTEYQNLVYGMGEDCFLLEGEKIVCTDDTFTDVDMQPLPFQITVSLLKNGQPTGRTAVVTNDNPKFRFDDLPKYDQDKKPNTYKVIEENVPAGMTAQNPDGVEFTFTEEGVWYKYIQIKNAWKITDNPLGKIVVRKNWTGDPSKLPDDWNCVIHMTMDGQQTGKLIKLTKDKLEGEFDGLQVFYPFTDVPHQYFLWEECSVPGATMVVQNKNVVAHAITQDGEVLDTVTFVNDYDIKDNPHNPDNGSIKAIKSSAITDTTNSNAMYNLAGAEYGIFRDAACTQRAGTLTTTASGWTNSWTCGDPNEWTYDPNINNPPANKTFYIKEVKAPDSYALNSEVVSFEVHMEKVGGKVFWMNQVVGYDPDTGHQITKPLYKQEWKWITPDKTFSNVKPFTDIPKSAPVDVVLHKKGINGKEPYPSLANAQFRIRYYDSTTSTGMYKREWILKTDANGEVKLDDAHKVSGDPFYYDSNRKPTIPLGCISIEEIQAPDGYYINRSKPENRTYVITPESGKTVEHITTYVFPTFDEYENKLTLYKMQGQPVDGNVFIPNTQFLWEKPNGTKTTITTDADGKIELWGLDFGVHKFTEQYVMDGYVNNARTLTVNVTQYDITKGTGYSYNVADFIYFGDSPTEPTVIVYNVPVDWSLKLRKTNDYDKPLKNARFTVYEDERCSRIVMSALSDQNGLITFSGLKDRKDYWIVETFAPDGYREPVEDPETMELLKFSIRADSTPAHNEFLFYLNGALLPYGTANELEVEFNEPFFANPLVSIHRINEVLSRLPETGKNDALLYATITGLAALAVLSLFSANKRKANR